jgi:hypothetical protein
MLSAIFRLFHIVLLSKHGIMKCNLVDNPGTAFVDVVVRLIIPEVVNFEMDRKSA